MKQKMNLSFQAEIEVSCQEFAFYLAFALSIHCACSVQVVNSFSSKAEALRFSDKVYQLLGVSEKQQRGPTTCQKHYKKTHSHPYKLFQQQQQIYKQQSIHIQFVQELYTIDVTLPKFILHEKCMLVHRKQLQQVLFLMEG